MAWVMLWVEVTPRLWYNSLMRFETLNRPNDECCSLEMRMTSRLHVRGAALRTNRPIALVSEG